MKFGSMRRDTQKEKVFARFSSSKPIRPKIKSNLKKITQPGCIIYFGNFI